jgi:hypothetical protein
MAPQIPPYRRGIRPAAPASFPTFVDTELARVQAALAALTQAYKDLEARVAALEP